MREIQISTEYRGLAASHPKRKRSKIQLLMDRVPWQLKFAVQFCTWRNPHLYYFHGMIRGHTGVFETDFDVALDGYPRSGNTYALRMLQLTQKSTRVRSHRHTPPYVLSAIRARKPVLLLIRTPVDTVLSWSIYMGFPVEYVIRQYIQYYSVLLKYKRWVCVVEFDELTRSFKNVITKLEKQYAVGLSCDFDEATLRSLAFQEIEEQHRLPNGDVNLFKVNRPDARREELKRQLLSKGENVEIDYLFSRAQNVYSRFTSPAT